jgi:hypothetical protein
VKTGQIRAVRRPSGNREWISFGAILALVALQIILFLYLVTIGWQFRSLMLPPGDPEIVVRTRTVFENGAWLFVNLVAGTVYLLRRRQLGRFVLLAVLALDMINSLAAAFGFLLIADSTTAIQWLVAALVPLVALVLLWHQPSESFSSQKSQSLGGR